MHQRAGGYSPSMQPTKRAIGQSTVAPHPDRTGSVKRVAEDGSFQTDDVPSHMGLRAFGLSLLADMPPPGAWVAAAPPAEPILHLRTTSAAEIAEHWSGLAAVGWEGTIDDSPFVVERGLAGAHRFVHGKLQRGTPAATRAIHHLSADAGMLRCAPVDPAEQSWWRVVLDSALFTVALLRGYEALHAGAIATPDGAIAIAATTGGGKSTLLLFARTARKTPERASARDRFTGGGCSAGGLPAAAAGSGFGVGTHGRRNLRDL